MSGTPPTPLPTAPTPLPTVPTPRPTAPTPLRTAPTLLPTAPTPRRPTMRDVLRIRGMRVLLAGELTSTFGDWAMFLALAIWVKTLTDSNSLAGLVLLAAAAPTLGAPLYGWVVDRFRRR